VADDGVIAGLDIGTTKICMIVGRVAEGKVNIIGLGSVPSFGIRKGTIVNIGSTVAALRKAKEEAELMAGTRISSSFVAIAGAHVRGINSKGMVAVRGKEVDQGDIRRAIEAAKAIKIPADREILHVIPQEFIIDDQDGIKEPIGISGIRLEVKVHIVTVASAALQNVMKCCRLAGINVEGVVLAQLASSEATLTQEEKDIGVALVDIGGGTSDIAVFSEGSPFYTTCLPLGGTNITQDITVGLRTSFENAEKIKKKYGCAISSMVGAKETIEVEGVGYRTSRTLTRKTLVDIIEPRVEEISSLIHEEIKRSGIDRLLAAGVVITGGCANLEGFQECAEAMFGLPTRRGYPVHIGGLVDVVSNPAFATSVGLVLYGASRRSRDFDGRKESLLARIKRWFKETF
jgi:cell division protein FtsA